MAEEPCYACGFINSPNSRFCGECGSSLKNECACGHLNSVNDKFCSVCGSSLDRAKSTLKPAFVAVLLLALGAVTTFAVLNFERFGLSTDDQANVFSQAELDSIAGRTPSRRSQSASSSTNTSSGTCSDYANLVFDAHGFIGDAVDGLNITGPVGVIVNTSSSSSVASVHNLSGGCIEGSYSFVYRVKTGIYLDDIKAYTGSFYLPANAEDCTVMMSGGLQCY